MKLHSFLSSLKGKNIAIIVHSGADIDAISSAAALYFSLNKKFNPKIIVPGHASTAARILAKNLQIPFQTAVSPQNLEEFNGIIIVDLNSSDMLGVLSRNVLDFKKPILLIDHHKKSNQFLIKSSLALIKENAISSAEIVLEELKESKLNLAPKIYSLLACGIIADSSDFASGSKECFSAIAECLRHSTLSFSQIKELFDIREEISEKIALIKSAQRAKIFGVGELVIVTTEIGAFEAGSATFLVKAGADIVFAGNSEKGEMRISARASSFALSSAGIDLAKDILSKLAEKLKGSSGGHSAAAAFNGKEGNINQALEECVALTFEFLKKKNPKAEIKEYS